MTLGVPRTLEYQMAGWLLGWYVIGFATYCKTMKLHRSQRQPCWHCGSSACKAVNWPRPHVQFHPSLRLFRRNGMGTKPPQAVKASHFQINYFTSCDPHHDIYTFCYSQIFWHSIWHILWHSIWHIFWHMFWHIFWHSIWQIFWHSIWHIFWHSIWHSIWHIFWHIFWHILHEVRQGTRGLDTRGWGPAGNTGRGWSWLRSGREHWAGMVVVEVRQGTLGVAGRGWGPTENTVRRGSRLRSGREHWAWMVVVEARQGTLGVDGRGWGPTENTVDRESQLSRRTRRTTRGGGQREEEERRGGGGPGNWHKI